MLNTLVVEDNANFREVLAEILRLEFPAMKVLEKASAEEALRGIEKRPPDLAFVDIKLPGMNGLELARQLRYRFPNIVIVVLTSYDMPEYREAAAKHRIDHFLLKGMSRRTEIVDLVKSIVADHPAV